MTRMNKGSLRGELWVDISLTAARRGSCSNRKEEPFVRGATRRPLIGDGGGQITDRQYLRFSPPNLDEPVIVC
jgi:hypothetical protein